MNIILVMYRFLSFRNFETKSFKEQDLCVFSFAYWVLVIGMRTSRSLVCFFVIFLLWFAVIEYESIVKKVVINYFLQIDAESIISALSKYSNWKDEKMLLRRLINLPNNVGVVIVQDTISIHISGLENIWRRRRKHVSFSRSPEE